MGHLRGLKAAANCTRTVLSPEQRSRASTISRSLQATARCYKTIEWLIAQIEIDADIAAHLEHFEAVRLHQLLVTRVHRGAGPGALARTPE